MVNALKNIKEYFPFVYKSGTADIGDLMQETLKKLTKLFMNYPIYILLYLKQELSVQNLY